ncbi:MAG: hypothetical protein GY851_27445 [bacterium]|nr:hypothetical protein [bacterium]
MKRKVLVTAIALMGMVLAGCGTLSRQPQMRDAVLARPDVAVRDANGETKADVSGVLKPGDSGVLTVRVEDRHRIVSRVVGVVREDTRIKFVLKDDGVGADEMPGDGIWSLQVDVPFLAPPGEYTLELAAQRSNGENVRVKTEEGVVPLQTTCRFVIEYPDQKS